MGRNLSLTFGFLFLFLLVVLFQNFRSVRIDEIEQAAFQEAAGGQGSLLSTVHSGDVDGDKKLDIIRRSTDFKLTVRQSSAKNKVREIADPPGADWSLEGLTDFNGDGTDDLIWRARDGHLVVWEKLEPQPKVLDLGIVENGIDIVGTGDFDGDGSGDLLWQKRSSGEVQVWIHQGTRLKVLDSLEPGWQIEALADFDGDAKTDVLWRLRPEGNTKIWFMNELTFKSESLTSVVHPEWRVLGSGDVDGDLRDDVVWFDGKELRYWFMNGAVAKSAHLSRIKRFQKRKPISVADFDGDGFADILWLDGIASSLSDLQPPETPLGISYLRGPWANGRYVLLNDR